MTSRADSSIRPPASPDPSPENRPDQRRAQTGEHGSCSPTDSA
jgi:hypothetical protein